MNIYIKAGEKIRLNVPALIGTVPLWILNGTECMIVMLLAALLHEAAHLTAIKCGKGVIKRIDVGFLCAEIVYSGEKMTLLSETVNSLAGVTVNIVSAAAAYAVYGYCHDRRAAFFAVCSVFLGIVNLLPVRGLDGGNALYHLLQMRYDANKAYSVCAAVSRTAAALTAFAALYLLIKTGMNTSLLLLCTIALITKN